MFTNSRVSQYSPNSEESDEQPLDFSKKNISSLTSISIKREKNGRDRHSTPSPEVRQSLHQSAANCFTTPSPSPPEHNPKSHHTNQVLCQLLTGALIPSSTGKLMAAATAANKNLINSLSVRSDSGGICFNGLTSQSQGPLSASSPGIRFNGLTSQSPGPLSTSSPGIRLNGLTSHSFGPLSSSTPDIRLNGLTSQSLGPLSASSPDIHLNELTSQPSGPLSASSSSNSITSNSALLDVKRSDGQQSVRKRGRPLPEDLKDEAYWERRRKNNEAAKRSRDARRAKESEIAIRAAFLEQENIQLRCEIAQLKTETTKLRCLLYNTM